MAMSRHCFLSVFKDYTVYMSCLIKRLFDLLQTNLFLPDVQKKDKKIGGLCNFTETILSFTFPKTEENFLALGR